MPAINLVIFDMDDVLCRYDFARRLACLAEVTGLEAAFIEAAIFGSGFDELGDRGRYTAEEYLQQFSAHLGVAVSRQDWLWARRQSIAPDAAVLALAETVRAQVPVAMLTNNGPVLREGLGEVFPQAAELFGERAIFSCQLASSKAEPAIFHAVLEILDGQPDSTLFIDDSETYIASAHGAGLRTHHFSGIDALAGTLRSFNLIPD
ncbi:MAG: HAD family phosphatase [Alphaproteobacteria bacterium]|nr:HAD family phosphatase [Alphaproteobacteria bacterium]